MAVLTPQAVRDRAQSFRIQCCHHCGCKSFILARNITGNGTTQYHWWCKDCERYAEKPVRWIPHDVVEFWHRIGALRERPDRLRIIENYSGTNPCQVCGHPNAELHHFAPQSLQALFGSDWNNWPSAWLCKEHHDLWHEIMTPWMSGRGSTPAGREMAQKIVESLTRRKNGK